jgi:hypothetical protein
MWHDDWVETEREQIRQAQLHGLELLAGHHLLKHRPHNALQVALAAAVAEPLRESPQGRSCALTWPWEITVRPSPNTNVMPINSTLSSECDRLENFPTYSGSGYEMLAIW